MRIAICGGGLFGATAAIHLARHHHDVHLYEPAGALMQAASAVNQARLHQGFHYPRSPETAAECQAGLRSFAIEYGQAIVGRGGLQHYAIARHGSRVTASQYEAFCLSRGLYARPVAKEHVGRLVNPEAVDVMFAVVEDRVDICALRSLVVRRLDANGVKVFFQPAGAWMRQEYDRIVIAAYASTNQVAAALGAPTIPIQFEVVEKPVVRMPERFRGVGVVVMDGEFCCVDPWGQAEDGLHVVGHVLHAIHARNTGLVPKVPGYLAPLLNRGMIPAETRPGGAAYCSMIDVGQGYIPALAEAEHVGSMFTVRAVLPNHDHDDARPTMVEQLDEQVIRVFGGKLACSVDAARRTADMLRQGANRREAA